MAYFKTIFANSGDMTHIPWTGEQKALTWVNGFPISYTIATKEKNAVDRRYVNYILNFLTDWTNQLYENTSNGFLSGNLNKIIKGDIVFVDRQQAIVEEVRDSSALVRKTDYAKYATKEDLLNELKEFFQKGDLSLFDNPIGKNSFWSLPEDIEIKKGSALYSSLVNSNWLNHGKDNKFSLKSLEGLFLKPSADDSGVYAPDVFPEHNHDIKCGESGDHTHEDYFYKTGEAQRGSRDYKNMLTETKYIDYSEPLDVPHTHKISKTYNQHAGEETRPKNIGFLAYMFAVEEKDLKKVLEEVINSNRQKG